MVKTQVRKVDGLVVSREDEEKQFSHWLLLMIGIVSLPGSRITQKTNLGMPVRKFLD